MQPLTSPIDTTFLLDSSVESIPVGHLSGTRQEQPGRIPATVFCPGCPSIAIARKLQEILSPVDLDDFTSNERSLIRNKERYDGSDFLGFPESFQ